MSCCSDALQISNRWYAPELDYKERHLGNFYANHPILSRMIIIPLAALSGFAKMILFPLISAVGIIAMPILAIYRAIRGESALPYLKAWGFFLLGAAVTVGFLGLTGFHIPIIYSSGLFLVAITVSVAFHVYKAAKEPERLSSN